MFFVVPSRLGDFAVSLNSPSTHGAKSGGLMRTAILSAAMLSLLLAATEARAWSNKEHMQLTRLAAERLIAAPTTPPAMKKWLTDALGRPWTADQEKDYFLHKRIGIIPRDADGLSYWATMPDMATFYDPPDKKVQPFGVNERMLHFLDLEYFMPDESKRKYAHDLSHKPALTDFPRDMKDPRYLRAGMLPFRVADCYTELVASIRKGRMIDAPGQYPRDEHATKWAGMLAHYAEDNTQPQHSTEDYKSATYFADKRKAPNVHTEVEYRMCDDDREDYMDLREAFWPLFVTALDKSKDPPAGKDPWQATLEVSLSSYDALPMIGEAAMAAAKQAGTPQNPTGPAGPFDTRVFYHHKGGFRGQQMTVMEMKALQQSWAVHRVEELWLQAWNEAQTPGADHADAPGK
jgi:hypothetical protein